MDTTELVRLAAALVALCAALAFSVRLNDDWPRLTKGWRVTRLSVTATLLFLAGGFIEVLLTEPGLSLGWRNIALPVSLVALLLGLWLVRAEEDAGQGWISVTEVEDILAEVESAHSQACTPPALGCVVARDRLRESIATARRRGRRMNPSR